MGFVSVDFIEYKEISPMNIMSHDKDYCKKFFLSLRKQFGPLHPFC